MAFFGLPFLSTLPLPVVPPNAGGIGTNPTPWATAAQLCVELGPMRERFAVDGTQVVERTFLVDWFRRKQWVDAMLGYTNTVPNMVPDVNGPPAGFLTVEQAANFANDHQWDLLQVISTAMFGAADANGGLRALRINTDALAAIRLGGQNNDPTALDALLLAASNQMTRNTPFSGDPVTEEQGIEVLKNIASYYKSAILPYLFDPMAAGNLVQDDKRPWLLHRTPPAQDPEYGYEHLYCSEVEMINAYGTMAPTGPSLTTGFLARNPDGTFLTTKPQAPPPVQNFALVFPAPPAPPIAQQPPLFGGKNQVIVTPLPKMVYVWDDFAIRQLAPNLVTQQLPNTFGYGLALYTARFTPRTYEIMTDAGAQELAKASGLEPELYRYVARAESPAVQAIPRPRYQQNANGSPVLDNLIWLEGPFPNTNNGLEQAGQILLHTEELRYVHEQLPDPPYNAIDACVGRINSLVFDGITSPPRDPLTLLCQAPKKERYRTVQGRVYWRMTYSFLYRKQGWHRLPCADGNFYAVGFKTPVNNQKTIYETADLNLLFRPEVPWNYQGGVI